MLSSESKKNIAQQVEKSKSFGNAPTGRALLKYLVKANIENRFLKEGIIDIEFFGSKADSDKSTPKVRVNMYNLRKKLDRYYETEGEEDEWRIVIEKGQYGVQFEKRKKEEPQLKLPKPIVLIPYVGLTIVLATLIMLLLPPKKPKLWKDFFDNKHETNLFIGDAFGYRSVMESGSGGWIRDFSINSLDDYYALLEEKPELKEITEPTDFYYSTRMSENATHDLARFFTQFDEDFKIKYATNTSFSELKEGNVIYVGRLYNQTDFIYLFNQANTKFRIEERSFTFSGNLSQKDTVFSFSGGSTDNDLTLVSRIPGPNNTEQFLFFSNHDIGVIATVEYFTNPDSIASFTKKHLKGTPYFTAVYMATGKERTGLNLDEVLVVPF